MIMQAQTFTCRPAARLLFYRPEPNPMQAIKNRWRTIRHVVAGILPAVEPGILPGGKIVRRTTRFPSPGLSSDPENYAFGRGGGVRQIRFAALRAHRRR